MSKFNSAQTSFRRGYLSKRFSGSTKVEDYYEGLEDIVNFFPMPQGGLKKRNGTNHLKDWTITEDPGLPYRPTLAYMYLDQTEAVIMLASRQITPGGWFEYYSTSGKVVNTSLSAKADAALSVMLSAKYQVSRLGKYLVFTSNTGAVEPVVFSTEVGATVEITIDTWFGLVDSDLPFEGWRAPYGKIIEESFALAAGTIVLPNDYFTADMVGQLFRFHETSLETDSFVRITAVTDAKNADFVDVPGGTSAVLFSGNVKDLRMAQFGPHTGYSKVTTGFQQRSVMANTDKSPDTLFGSSVRSRFFFLNKYLYIDRNAPVSEAAKDYGLTASVSNTDPFTFNIASDYDTAIEWLVGGNVLYVGKTDEERIATGYDDALGPLSVSIQKKSTVGGKTPYAVGIDQGVFYISGDEKSINYLTFNERNGASSAIGAEATSFGLVEEIGEDVTIERIISMPGESLIFGLLSNGDVVSITYSPSVNNFAWAKHEFSFEVVDMLYSAHDRKVYLLAKYPGSGTLTLESFVVESDFKGHISAGSNVATVLDGAYIDLNPILGTILNLERFANQEVTVITPEYGVQAKTVDAGGVLTLDGNVTGAMVGQKISAYFVSMRVSAGREYGETNGRPKRVDTLICDVLNSYGGRWASINGNQRYENLKYKNVEQYSGLIEIKPDTTFSKVPQIRIEHDDAYPFILRNIVFKGVTFYD